MTTNNEFVNELNQLMMDKILTRMYRENFLETGGLNALSDVGVNILAEQYCHDALAGLDGLDGYLSRSWRRVKRGAKKVARAIQKPARKLRKALGIKTPKFLKKLEHAVKKVGYKIDRYKVQIAAGAALVVGGAMFGPQILSALQGAGAWTMTTAKAGLAKMSALGGAIGAKAKKVGAYISSKFAPASAAEIAEAEAGVSSPGFFSKYLGMAKNQLEKITGMKFSSDDAKQLLGKALFRERNALRRKLSSAKRRARSRERAEDIREQRTQSYASDQRAQSYDQTTRNAQPNTKSSALIPAVIAGAAMLMSK